MKHKLNLILFIVLTVASLSIVSCKKEDPYMSNAKIIGLDYSMCPCCGGTKIIIDNVFNPNGNAYFLAGQLPTNFNLDNNPQFPIEVKIDWKIDSVHCFGNYVDITRIAKR